MVWAVVGSSMFAYCSRLNLSSVMQAAVLLTFALLKKHLIEGTDFKSLIIGRFRRPPPRRR
jgi:hypothetical protein